MDELELTTTYDKAPLIEAMKTSMQQKGKEYKEAELYKDKTWIEASSLVYKMKEGKDFQGYTEELAQYGIDKMSEFNYNVSFGMVPDVLDVEDADHDTQVAFAYMMDAYDKKDVTIEGFGRAVKELALDPTSYIGIGTLGAGFAMRKTGAELAKEGLKNRLMAKISSYLTNEVAIGATEGALYTAGDEIARESVYQDAGMMDGYSPENIAIAGGLGAVAGGGIVKGIKLAGKGIDIANKAGEEAIAQSAGGGTPQSNTFYHGTSAEFEDFKPTKSLREGFMGSLEEVETNAHFFTKDKSAARVFAENRAEFKGGKPRIIEADLKMKNPIQLNSKPSNRYIEKDGGTYDTKDNVLVSTNSKHVDRLNRQEKFRILSDATGVDLIKEDVARVIDDGRLKDYEFSNEGLLLLLDRKDVVDHLKKKGYDSAILQEGELGESYAVFSNKQIKQKKKETK